MTRIQVDQPLHEKLGSLQEHLELCDEQGRVLGHFLPDDDYKELIYALCGLPLSDEEVARRLAEPGRCTLEELWKKLGRT